MIKKIQGRVVGKRETKKGKFIEIENLERYSDSLEIDTNVEIEWEEE